MRDCHRRSDDYIPCSQPRHIADMIITAASQRRQEGTTARYLRLSAPLADGRLECGDDGRALDGGAPARGVTALCDVCARR